MGTSFGWSEEVKTPASDPAHTPQPRTQRVLLYALGSDRTCRRRGRARGRGPAGLSARGWSVGLFAWHQAKMPLRAPHPPSAAPMVPCPPHAPLSLSTRGSAARPAAVFLDVRRGGAGDLQGPGSAEAAACGCQLML
eukprot:CAMPEP_0173439116 /NCGR_PEP_ID=MMETSP1357-20121228/20776_1 /TAXON_ID=77926 /ORGANISM="Hemiselmis rufescens, Strain PCC563" /LENGTH=136 /DNA_ID=CAMNT_0014404453 /DNA_START=12 /DNA_END=422 /DNA_ORIENTATION=-